MAFEALSPSLLAILRFGAHLLAQWWRHYSTPDDNNALTESISVSWEQDSQRSPQTFMPLVHTHTVLPPSTHPVLIISRPSEATIRLLEYSQQVTPEFILYACSFGVVCSILIATYLSLRIGFKTFKWLFNVQWPFQRTPPTSTHQQDTQQLSEAARRLFHYVRVQNPELVGETRDFQELQRLSNRRR